MKQFRYSNAPLNIPALEALEGMAGIVPPDIREHILEAPLDDDLSGLRQIGWRFEGEQDQWRGTLQPKKDIGDYVESNGISVPKRFDSLDEALRVVREGGSIIVRSEHPLEYDQFSGLLDSHVVNADSLKFGDNELTRAVRNKLPEDDALHLAKWETIKRLPMQRYLALTGQDEHNFYREMSYSFWEHIKGKNIAVVADDAVSGRYHMTSFSPGDDDRSGRIGGIFNETGDPFNASDADADTMSKFVSSEKIAEIIAMYETIRGLPKFLQRQCPIIEMQLTNDAIYFLQYYKARPFRLAQDFLDQRDYNSAEGWHKAKVVRGALGSFVTLRAALNYPSFPRSSGQLYMPPLPEEASFDTHHDIGLSEVLSPSRIAFLSGFSARSQYSEMADGSHERRSRWFKPAGSLALGRDGYDALLTQDAKTAAFISVRNMTMARFVLDIASDGLTGFVRLNPDSEQPVFGSNL